MESAISSENVMYYSLPVSSFKQLFVYNCVLYDERRWISSQKRSCFVKNIECLKFARKVNIIILENTILHINFLGRFEKCQDVSPFPRAYLTNRSKFILSPFARVQQKSRKLYINSS